jgi:hypothetical protein
MLECHTPSSGLKMAHRTPLGSKLLLAEKSVFFYSKRLKWTNYIECSVTFHVFYIINYESSLLEKAWFGVWRVNVPLEQCRTMPLSCCPLLEKKISGGPTSLTFRTWFQCTFSLICWRASPCPWMSSWQCGSSGLWPETTPPVPFRGSQCC